jgi:predicted CoA-substrate-specific enzyme activase
MARPAVGYVCTYVPVELIEAAGFLSWRLRGGRKETPRADAYLHPNLCPLVRSLLEALLEESDLASGRLPQPKEISRRGAEVAEAKARNLFSARSAPLREPQSSRKDVIEQRGVAEGPPGKTGAPKLAGLVLTNSCDAMRRLYDVVAAKLDVPFTFMLDVPRKVSPASIAYFRQQLLRLWEQLRDAAPAERPPDEIAVVIKLHNRRRHLIRQLTERLEQRPALIGGSTFHDIIQTAFQCESQAFLEALTDFIERLDRATVEPAAATRHRPRVAVSGSILDDAALIRMTEQAGACVVAMDTCAGLRAFEGAVSAADEPLLALAERYLSRPPCSRMQSIRDRMAYIESLLARTRAEGLIYHTLKFCDTYAYDIAALRQSLPAELPVLAIESEYTPASLGQAQTRIEAFVEILGRRKHVAAAHGRGRAYVVGIDGGSLSTEAVVLNDRGRIVGSAMVHTGANSLTAASAVLTQSIETAGLSRSDVAFVVATGYSRKIIPFADEVLTEIACHARGVRAEFPQVRTVIDIGGQDSKAIVLGDDGEVVNFAMNDKCAAGTGRFLELMARTLEIQLDRMGELSLRSGRNVPISSMCAVFAESEVVSLIAEGYAPADIVRGLHASIAGRVIAMVRRVEGRGPFAMTGGVAKNIGVVRELEQRLGEPLLVPADPQMTGAIGAALFALDRATQPTPAVADS